MTTNISTRLVASVTIEFDCGSEYGGSWTFEAAMKDAERTARNKCAKLVGQAGITSAVITDIKSFTISRPLV